MSEKVDWTWALMRYDFSTAGDYSGLKAVVPWGAEAIVVTGEAAYLAKEDELTGFTMQRIARR